MTAPVTVRDAATVMLVRDGAAGLEVFMLRRNLRSVFVAGAHVFPGGAVDPADRHADLEPRCEGRTDADASAVLGLDPPTGGLAYWVAAIRECFEEAGVLLAYDRAGLLVDFSDPGVEARFVRHRRAVDLGRRRLVEVCAEEGLRLAVDRLHYFSHWVTPVGAPRRYDTRFFVAGAPEGQIPLHDERETIAHTWITPSEALSRHRAGAWELILPTQRSLEAIAPFEDARTLLATVAAAPGVVADGEAARVVLPGDGGSPGRGWGRPCRT
jgi:8-oxo-dGTP pyrophosphatase MutT (NUDIX family)